MKLPHETRAVITGGGSGLGRALALRLAKHHRARLLIADVNEAGAAETVALAKKAGGDAFALRCDVTKVEDVEAAAKAIEAKWNGVDLVVNNAGVAAAGAVGDLSLEAWDWIMKINLWGVIHGCHVFAPRLKAQKSGFILNVASSAGIASLPDMAAYNVTKAGVVSLSETLFAELAPYSIGMSVLCPTFFKTNLLDSFRSPTAEHKKLAQAMFDRSTITADAVAAAGLAGLENNQLVVIPQADGKLVWGLKRLAPGLFFKAIAFEQKKGWVRGRMASK